MLLTNSSLLGNGKLKIGPFLITLQVFILYARNAGETPRVNSLLVQLGVLFKAENPNKASSGLGIWFHPTFEEKWHYDAERGRFYFSRTDKNWFSHLLKCVFKNSQKLCTSMKMAVPPKWLKNSHTNISSAKVKLSRIGKLICGFLMIMIKLISLILYLLVCSKSESESICLMVLVISTISYTTDGSCNTKK